MFNAPSSKVKKSNSTVTANFQYAMLSFGYSVIEDKHLPEIYTA